MGNVASTTATTTVGTAGYLTSYYDKDILNAPSKGLKGHPEALTVTPDIEGKESGIFHSYASKDCTLEDLYKQYYSSKDHLSLASLMKATCAKYGDSRNALAWRNVERIEKTEITTAEGKTKPWEYLHLGPVQHKSFKAMWESMSAFGYGLRKYLERELAGNAANVFDLISPTTLPLSRVPSIEALDAHLDLGDDTDEGQRAPEAAAAAKSIAKNPFAGLKIGIYEETRFEWLVSCYGLWSQQMVGVTVYANLGDDALLYAFNEAELSTIICNGKSVGKVAKICVEAGVKIPTMIYLDDIPPNTNVFGATLVKWTDVLQQGFEAIEAAKKAAAEKASAEASAFAGKMNTKGGNDAGVAAATTAGDFAIECMPEVPDDTALIMYTSGTTGDPKGVVLSHGNLFAAVNSFNDALDQHVGKEKDLTYVAFLPLAHILEFAAENVFLMNGALVCYGTPRTLTSLSARPTGDFEEYKPVVVLGVPRIFETIKKGIEGKLPPKGTIKRDIFDRAYADRVAGYKKGLRYPAYDRSVFSLALKMFGGRCRVIGSGGAAISPETQEFMSVVLNCFCGQGYGLTETCAQTTLTTPWDMGVGSSGTLLNAVQIKLVDTNHWKHTNKPSPQGEIWIRGPNVCKGYYRQPAKTKEAFTEDGWFKTGDIGSIDDKGALRIIGRVKALAKNLNGEYIAIETLESIYVLNDLAVPNGVCVLVHPQRAYITALVSTDEAKAKRFAASIGIENAEWPQVLEDPTFRKKATEAFAKTAKDRKRLPFELVKHVRVVADEWTAENGIMTAAMKLKRHEIDAVYKATIAELFASE